MATNFELTFSHFFRRLAVMVAVVFAGMMIMPNMPNGGLLAQVSPQSEPTEGPLPNLPDQLFENHQKEREYQNETNVIADSATRQPRPQSKKLQEIVRRARLVGDNNAHYLKQAVSGEVIPFADLKRRYVDVFPLLLTDLSAQYDAVFEERDPARRKPMIQAIQKALFPVGVYLRSAGYEDAEMTLTQAQYTELKRLQELDPRTQTGKRDAPELVALSDPLTYTMLHLPVYLEVKAQPHSSVYFRSGGGGQFSNGLPLQEVKANEQGLAATSWVSKGDAVGVAVITATSPQSGNSDFFRVNVVGLSLNPLPEMPVFNQFPDAVQNKLKSLEINEVNRKAVPKLR